MTRFRDAYMDLITQWCEGQKKEVVNGLERGKGSNMVWNAVLRSGFSLAGEILHSESCGHLSEDEAGDMIMELYSDMDEVSKFFDDEWDKVVAMKRY